jgi:integrase
MATETATKLTDDYVKHLKLPAGKSELLQFDAELPGFGVRLRAGGKLTWIVQYRIGRKQRRKTLGAVTEAMNAARARKAADKDLAKVKLGGDPQKEKVEARDRSAETFPALVARYLERQKARLRPRSYQQIRTHLTNHWKAFNRLSIHDIGRRNVAVELVSICNERGPYAANRARTSLSTFFTWAMKEGLVEANPVVGTNKQANENKRERVLSDADLVDTWRACGDNDYGSIVKLLILTGVRRDEAGGIARPEVDLMARKWTLPAERTKNKRTYDLPLSDAAMAILAPAIERADSLDRELLFGERATTPFSGWSKAKAQLDARIASGRADEEQKRSKARAPTPAPWVLHDIRRTVATRMGDLGVLPHVVEAVLNHVSGSRAGVAGTYNRALYWPEKRQALDLWAAHIESLLEGRPASNVVSREAERP